MMQDERLALICACEQRLINAWPAQDTLIVDGWALRYAHGYSGRANSATALTPGARLDASALAMVEDFFRERHLAPCLRFTPLVDAAFAAALEARGYRKRDASIGMIAPLDKASGAAEPGLLIEHEASDDWVRGVARLQSGTKKDNVPGLAAIVSRIRIPAGFVTLHHEGAAVGYALVGVERSMAEISSVILDPAFRGKGLGKRLVAGALDWAAAQGARRAYLQVEDINAVAANLYAGFGFAELYRYRTMILPAAT